MLSFSKEKFVAFLFEIHFYCLGFYRKLFLHESKKTLVKKFKITIKNQVCDSHWYNRNISLQGWQWWGWSDILVWGALKVKAYLGGGKEAMPSTKK